ncbi:MAG: 3-phosphoshikimate 1-carboxyvinyltransferase [Gammaproteobacteria bacterium]
MSVAETIEVAPGGTLGGRIEVPGDKSISHRAVMFGALADGLTEVRGCLMGEDVVSTINAFRAMGVDIVVTDDGPIEVHGRGVDGLRAPAAPLDLGNSGTSMRLLCGILAGAGIAATLTGDASLSRRPMRRVAVPLGLMGADVATADDGTPPIVIRPVPRLTAIDYELPVASAQVKSAVLLAGLFADGTTRVREPAPTRDHTERMLRAFGVEVEVDHGQATVAVAGGQRLTATAVDVPADISSAAFFIVGAAIAEGGHVTLPAVGVNPTRTGVIDIMRLLGAEVVVGAPREKGGEPVADIEVRASRLRGADIPPALVPLAIDEFPAIFVAAACAEGTTVVRGAAELRHKESDRIAVMAAGLTALGCAVETFDDGIAITGSPLAGGTVAAHGDHRIAMAFAMAALRATGPIRIEGADAIATSFPAFPRLAAAAGLRLGQPGA